MIGRCTVNSEVAVSSKSISCHLIRRQAYGSEASINHTNSNLPRSENLSRHFPKIWDVSQSESSHKYCTIYHLTIDSRIFTYIVRVGKNCINSDEDDISRIKTRALKMHVSLPS